MKTMVIVLFMLVGISCDVIASEKSSCDKNKEKSMISETVKDAVLKPVITYFDGLKKHDFTIISSAWHKNGKMYVGSESRDITFFQKLPPFIGFELDKAEILAYDEKIALVKVEWRMTMPDSTGFHNSYINLIEENAQWLIISKTDYGIEKMK